jgi:surface polysaccharide O-acyltransferase-like enzyme
LALVDKFLEGSNVMWFVVVLFIFSLVYALVRRIGGNVSRAYNVKLSFRNAVVLIVIIAACAFLIRLKFPIYTLSAGIMLGYFTFYITFFIVGILASRSDILQKIRYKTSVICLVCGIVFGLGAWGGIMLQSGVLDGVWSYLGGLNMASAVFALWESSMAVIMVIGLVGVFKEKLNHQRKFGAWMSDNSFAVYMFHLQIIIAVALLARPLDLPPVVKWLATSAVCLPLCYGAAYFIFRRIPLLKKIL